ncbi:hypothetical protein BV898_03817 [Hypsibius exemplaris]|nr:hypothetical protein BV898_03817 [Hypsibius exemplaris]
MGAFFYVRSVNLVEDVPINEADFISHPEMADAAYKQQAYNCWVCAALYVLLLAFSGHQMMVNIRPAPYTGM